MTSNRTLPDRWGFATGLIFTLLLGVSAAAQDRAGPVVDDPPDKKKADDEAVEPPPKIRWGQRANESDEKYDRRYERLLKKIKKDDRDDRNGGPTPLWTLMGHPFLVRSDISAEFTADTAMYMEMLHREYGTAYRKLGLPPSKLKEPVEVVVFADRDTYKENGGTENSGGQFMTHLKFPDRGPFWPAGHYRLMQFTDGIEHFAYWPKGVLKHEAAHMEMRMRLGLVVDHNLRAAWAVDCPRWFDEGQASVFEHWDFDKTVEENFAEIPNRGRYAPVIRRIHGTDKWQDFHYVWTIDPSEWHKDMASQQGYLNYCQAWSLAGYMMNEGIKGRKDFRKIYNLSKTVGADRRLNTLGTKTRTWETAFPERERKDMEKNWVTWVGDVLPKTKQNPGEDRLLIRMGIDPEVTATLEHFDKEKAADLREKLEKEDEAEPKNKIEK